MSRYIDADKLAKYFKEKCRILLPGAKAGDRTLIAQCDTYYSAQAAVINSRSADVVPVVHAHWIPHYDDFDGLVNECSHCHAEGMIDGKYCPNCGAKMDEVTE